MIHTVKGFGIVNKTEGDFFLEVSCFFHDPADVGNLISGSSEFSKSSLNIWKFLVRVLLKPSFENFEHCFASMWDECDYVVVWTFFGLAFFGIGMKTDLYQFCSHCWVFHICWLAALSQQHLLGFEIAHLKFHHLHQLYLSLMLPKAHLTSHSKMSGSRWVVTPSWLSGSLRSFVWFFCVFLPPLLNIFCFC